MINLLSQQDPHLLLCRPAFQAVSLQSIFVPGVISPQIQGFTFLLDELHKVPVTPLFSLSKPF